MRRTTLTLIPVGILAATVAGVIAWFLVVKLAEEMTLALRVVITAGAVAGVLLFVGGLLFFAVIGWEKWLQAGEQTKQARLATKEHEIKILAQTRIIQTAGAGDQVYLHDLLANLTTPLHLQAGPINGSYVEPSDLELEHWRINQLAHARTPRAIAAPEQPAQLAAGDALPPLLPVVLQAQRLIVVGGSDSGKSTIAKHIIAGRAEASQIIPIDPHAPSKVLGYDVIGAGRDWDAIGCALESLELLMHERYGDVAAGFMGYFQHSRISVLIDEWYAIVQRVDRAGAILATLLTESRKVNIHLTLLTNSTTLEGLGLPSAQLKKSAIIVELVGGQGQPHRAFVHPQSETGTDGRKARKVEYALPGPFTGFAQPAGEVVLELPDPAIIKVQKMSDEGASLRSMAKEFFGVDHPNGGHINQIKGLLARAEAARKARQGRA
jgi:hypothetical protein